MSDQAILWDVTRIPGGLAVVGKRTRKLIARMEGRPSDGGVQAMASLIAAAPTYEHAWQAVVAAFNEALVPPDKLTDTAIVELLDSLLDEWGATIATAKGETSPSTGKAT